MMGYVQGFCASIAANGSVLRESPQDGFRTVRLPFNSEYKIVLKNTNFLRSKVQILIDGLDISSLGKLVLNGGESVTIERFIDNYNGGKAFKFISREEGAATGALQDPTSDQLGIIEVRFWSEFVDRRNSHILSGEKERGGGILRSMQKSAPTATYSGGDITSTGSLGTHDGIFVNSDVTFDSSEIAFASSASNHIGGTAEGSHSSQQFREAEEFKTVRTPVIIKLRLLAPEVARFVVENGWVIKKPENIRITDTYKVERGEIWAKLS